MGYQWFLLKLVEMNNGFLSVYADFLAFSKVNPVVAGLVGIWALGVVTFFLKIVPIRIFSFIKSQLTTTLVINSQDTIYHEFLSWVSENNMHSFVRNLNYNNSSRHGSGKATISIGYGKTLFFFNKYLFLMSRVMVEANMTSDSKEIITLTLFGRNRKIFTNLFELIHKSNEDDDNYLNVWVFNSVNNNWILVCRQFKRDLDTVVINETAKAKLLKHVDEFKASKEWHRRNGIPYRTGIMLEGPPGTGKTSLIKALCSSLDKHLYVIDLGHISDASLQKALSTLPEGALVAIEDIDTINLTNRGKKILHIEPDAPEVVDSSESMAVPQDIEDSSSMFKLLTLGGVLNAIDGLISAEGRILIATSNCTKNLDPALMREGRFDLKLKIGYMTNKTLAKYLRRFYPDYRRFHEWDIKVQIAPCMVQKLVFDNRDDPEAVLEQVCDKRQRFVDKGRLGLTNTL